jgi:hypothetical protein
MMCVSKEKFAANEELKLEIDAVVTLHAHKGCVLFANIYLIICLRNPRLSVRCVVNIRE